MGQQVRAPFALGFQFERQRGSPPTAEPTWRRELAGRVGQGGEGDAGGGALVLPQRGGVDSVSAGL